MYAALIRAAANWRGLRMTEFEQRQLKAIQEDLDRAHTERPRPVSADQTVISPTHFSSTPRT
jgi:hypothetical protein